MSNPRTVITDCSVIKNTVQVLDTVRFLEMLELEYASRSASMKM